MALVLFESRVNMITAATPSIGGFLVAYDTLDGVLKQKDDQGVITPIGSGGGIGSLSQTLSIGNTTGTNSIYLDVNSGIKSSGGSASLRLDNGSPGNYVELSSSNLTTGSTLTMNDTTIQLKGLSSSIQMSTTDIRLNFGVNQFLLQNNNSYLKLGTTNVLEFTTATSSRATGNRVPAFISSNGSRFSNTVTNSVIIGGSGITGTQSNSVYTPNLIIKDGGYVKGTIGDGQLKFNSNNEAYLTSLGRIIGILNSKNNLVTDYSGIFITDVDNEFITQTEKTNITFISSSNATVGAGLYNTVVVGGKDLIIDSTDTVYLGGTVDINNQYKLPLSDGTSGQVIKTDGAGNLSWSSGVGTPVITVTAATFAGLSSFSSSSTYRITGVDTDLYGGTEIYLTTNSQGILNDVGEGKFYNPKYDQTVEGYRIWGGTSSSYATASVVYWGGRAWSNNSGTNTSSPLTIFFLNPTEWTVIPYTNGLYYRISYDKIKYDRATDKIIYRNERGTNIVSTNSENIRYWIDDIGLYDPIKVFQWGNVYSSTTAVGIASQNIVNSYNENINFRGILQTNITMNNSSAQFNMDTDINSLQDNLILNNYFYDRQSTLLGSEYSMSFQSGSIITIDGNLMVKGSTTTISSENLIVKDPIIVLAASQSGTPTLDSGLFVDRGIGATQAFIWDESMDEFKFISTPDGDTVSGNVTITDYSNVRTGVLKVGTGDVDSDDRFIVSSSDGLPSLVIDEVGNSYNRSKGITNTLFGYGSQKNSLYDAGISIQSIFQGDYNYAEGLYEDIQLTLYSGPAATTYPTVNIEVFYESDGDYYYIAYVQIVNNGTGFTSNSTRLTATFGGGTGFYVTIDLIGLFNTSFGYNSLLSNFGKNNTAIGYNSLLSNTTGYNNTAMGASSSSLNTTGYNNTAVGQNSLYYNTTGTNNIAIGKSSLYYNTTGGTNTAVGLQSLFSNTTGNNNTAVGASSLYNNTGGYANSALGESSLYSNTNGSYNVGVGKSSLYLNRTGSYNIGIGHNSLYQGTSSNYNIGIGASALFNTKTSGNIGIGYSSLYSNTTGYTNMALGYQSLYSNTTGYNNVGLGVNSLYNNTTGTNSVAIGYQSLYKSNTGNWNTALGVESLRNNTTIVTEIAGTFSPGSGYTPGTYPHIVLFGVAGTSYYPGNNISDYPQVTIVVGAGGTVSSATLTWKGTVVPDATVQFGIQTGVEYYQIPGPGSGFRINILSIGRAGESNTGIGYQALYNLKTGSRNVAVGRYAGSYYGYMDDTNDSIYIGYNANSVNFNVSNEIVIGATALGNGSHTVTLGNDNIQKTILKGNVAVGFTGTSVSPNCNLEVKGHQTFTLPDNNMTSGDVVYFGNVTTGLTPGSIYYYDSGDWTVADASLATSSSGLLAIALGTSSSDGMLLRGFARFDLSAVYSAMTTLGTVQFLSVTAGEFEEAQPVSSGEVVRVIGYCVDTSLLYFCPDTTWIELL